MSRFNKLVGITLFVVLLTLLSYALRENTLIVAPIDLERHLSSEAQTILDQGLLPHGLKDVKPDVEISTLFLQAVPGRSELDLVQELSVSLPESAPWCISATQHNVSLGVATAAVKADAVGIDRPTIIFGVATTLERLDDSLETFAHWASKNSTTIVALIPPVEPIQETHEPPTRHSHTRFHYSATASSIEALHEKATYLSIDLIIKQSTLDFVPRVVSLLQILHDEAERTATFMNKTIDWIGIIDDDTFFPSYGRLVRTLSAYNASLPHYIGGLTEDFRQVNEWGYFAYGGAGIFLSMALVKHIRPYAEVCLGDMQFPSGDQKIAECISRYTTTKLTLHCSLHQVDLNGDQTGFYEAVRPIPVSLHHYKSLAHFDMVTISYIADVTGQDSILQKYHLSNGWWMTHGFSIVKYSDEDGDGEPLSESTTGEITLEDGSIWRPPKSRLSHRDGAMEFTFDSPSIDDQRFWHSMAPLRPKDPDKQQYLLESAVKENESTMTLYYVRRQDGIGQSVIRVIWTNKPISS